jgi:hypothetical protein
VLPCILSLSTSCRSSNEPTAPSDHSGGTNEKIGTAVYWTDSTEWRVYIAKTGVLYGSGYSVDSPYHIPTRDEATILRTISCGPSGQRYVTCDGYTFGMPSASVTKAGSKTKYSVLGLWKRKTTIEVTF